MGTPYMGEIRLFSMEFAPKGWAMCNGQYLAINQNQALFSILGTLYGGNGVTTFALPDFRGRVPIHYGNGIELGQVGGETSHTVSLSELPAHNHQLQAKSSAATLPTPNNGVWAAASVSAYHTGGPGGGNFAMNPQLVKAAGGSQPHNNMQPYLTLNFCIALQGIFPTRN
ncbi:phage tail protein [Paenibacillus sp. NPDC058174]|uniref:phage tail protein n=1 Tax=Paenibacillus sp. NPDC058174 TaxID=3346366 RepID=UPI0036D957F7